MAEPVKGNGGPQVQPVAQLVISLLPNGQVIVGGQIDDPILPFGMLQRAALEVYEYQRKKPQESRIVPVTLMPRIQ